MTRYFVLAAGALAAFSAIGAGGWALVPAKDWTVSGPFGGTATTVAIDPRNTQTVLAGARNSLLYQSSNAGGSWTLLDFPRRNMGEVTSILVDPSDSTHYLVGSLDAFGGGLYESTDGGKNWTANNDLKNVGVRALAAAPADPAEFVAGTLSGVELSHDSGKTWRRISDPNNLEMQGITAVAVDPQNPNIIYAGTPHLPWRTSDGGKTWQSIHSGMIDDSDVFSIYISPKSPATVFASACSGIYESSSRGSSWRKIAGIPKTSRRTHVIRVDPARAGTIFAGTTMGLFRSADAGLKWTVLTPTQVNALAFAPASPEAMYLAMEYEGIGKSLDGGNTIQLADSGFVDRQISAMTRSGDKLFAVEMQSDDTIFRSTDAGVTWTRVGADRALAGVHLLSIAGSAANSNNLLAAAPRQLYKSNDGGENWHPLEFHVISRSPVRIAPHSVPAPASSRARPPAHRGAPANPPHVQIRTLQPGDINGLYTIENHGQESIAVATSTGLYFTRNFGELWSRADLGNGSPIVALYVSAGNDGRMIAKASDALYVTKDGGDHWDRLYFFPLPMREVNSIAISADPTAWLLCATSRGLYSSPDGVKWFSGAPGLPSNTTLFATAYRAGTAFVAAYGDLYKSNDGGAHWSPVPTRFRSLPIRQLWLPNAASPRLYAITSGLGILFHD